MSGPVVHLDFETYSEVDLRAVGAYAYAEHPSTEILCMAWAIGDEPPRLWLPGDPFPFDLIGLGIAAQIVAWNAPFERQIWAKVAVPRLGWPLLPDDQLYCAAAMAANMGLPRDLATAARALGLPAQKDAAGHRIMLKLSKPRRPSKNNPATRWTPESAPEDFRALYAYCLQDVETERGVHRKLYALSDREREIFLLDQKINDRGVKIDRPLIAAAQRVVDDTLNTLDGNLSRVTEGAVTAATQTARLAGWINERGVMCSGVAAAEIRRMLALDLPADVRAALECRQLAGKSSTAKLEAMLAAAGSGDRIRGSLLYYGAARTGRWSGRLHQPQNYPRGDESVLAVLDAAVDAIATGMAGFVEAMVGNPMEAVSTCLRPMMVAADGHDLIAVDFANIEGRVLAWLAGETWKLDAFRAYDAGTGPDLYKVAYSRSLGVPVDAVTKPQRQVGKVIELACLGPNTLVATRRAGYIPIWRVTQDDEVWDGVEWVRHSGLVLRGEKETILLDGVELTRDHLVMVGTEWTTAETVASSANTLSRALATSSAASPCWPSKEARGFESSARAALRHIWCTITTCGKAVLLRATSARRSAPATGSSSSTGTPTSARTTRTGVGCATASRLAFSGAATRTTAAGRTTAAAESRSRLSGSPTAGGSSPICLRSMDGTSRNTNSTESTTTEATSRATCDSSANRITSETAAQSQRSKRKSLTYDLLCAGPRNRFTIRTDSGTLLVHNCGYQGWVGAFQTFAALYGISVADDEAARLAGAWREAHPKVVDTWKKLNIAAVRAVLQPGMAHAFGRITYVASGGWLWCRLPSGRVLAYCNPRVGPNDRGEQAVHFWGVDSVTKQWLEISGYGGLWTENIVQAISRDLLAEAMLRVEAAGYPLVLTVHDELVAEVPHGVGSVAEMESLAAEIPSWAEGLPVAAAGWRSRRYQK